MEDTPFSKHGIGRQCSYSPTGWCLEEIGSLGCAQEKGCVLPTDDADSVVPV